MNKAIQFQKMEIELIKKTQSEGTLEKKKLGIQKGTRKAWLANRIQEMEDRI